MSGLSSALGFDLDDVPDEKTLPDGEYELRIINAELSKQDGAKGNSEFIKLLFAPVGEEYADAKAISHILMLPDPEKDANENRTRQRRVKKFVLASGVTWPVESVEDFQSGWIGCTCWATLKTKEDPEYGEQNQIRTFQRGR